MNDDSAGVRRRRSRRFTARLFPPPRLDWIQLEVTSRCGALCTYCPQHTMATAWRGKDFPFELLPDLLPALLRASRVHLQGWGEPLLYPRLLELVRRLTSAGCRVSTTTNGALLDATTAEELVDCGIDFVAISLAGADAATHGRLRPGVPLECAVSAARALAEARSRRRSPSPRIHLAYMLVRSGLESFPRLPELAIAARADEVVVSGLSLVGERALLKEASLADDEEGLAEVRRRLAEVGRRAEERGVLVSQTLIDPFAPPAGCPENVGRSLFVGATGEVHPCVMTGLPSARPQLHWTWRGPVERRRLVLGDLRCRSIREVWRRPAARSFRGRIESADPPPECRDCLERWTAPLAPERRLLVPDF